MYLYNKLTRSPPLSLSTSAAPFLCVTEARIIRVYAAAPRKTRSVYKTLYVVYYTKYDALYYGIATGNYTTKIAPRPKVERT